MGKMKSILNLNLRTIKVCSEIRWGIDIEKKISIKIHHRIQAEIFISTADGIRNNVHYLVNLNSPWNNN